MATKKKIHRWADIKKKHPLSPEAETRVRRDILVDSIAVTLQELREMAGKTQADVADVLEKTQGELSRIERRRDVLLSTLREYVEALGGRLELRAVFDDRSLVINQMLADDKSAA